MSLTKLVFLLKSKEDNFLLSKQFNALSSKLLLRFNLLNGKKWLKSGQLKELKEEKDQQITEQSTQIERLQVENANLRWQLTSLQAQGQAKVIQSSPKPWNNN